MRLILAILAGLVLGSSVNMGLIMIGPSVIPMPEGVIPGDMDSLAANIHLFEPKHFVFPWLAHALGTLVGALVAGALASSNKPRACFAIGLIFLLGGVMMVFSVDAPLWFDAADLALAYLPMAWLATLLTCKQSAPA